MGSKFDKEARSEESVARIERLLSQIYFQPGREEAVGIIERLEVNYDQRDRAGVDIILTLTAEFGEFVGMKELMIQSKSSEAGVEQFANTGKKKFGRTGGEWKKMGLILLNGQWADGSIVTDFLVQLTNLIGFYGNQEEVWDFVACFDEATAGHFRSHYLQIEQYRCHLLEWVAGRPRADDGGRVFYFD